MSGKSIFSNKLLQSLRIDELIGLIFLSFTLLMASVANLQYYLNGMPEADNATGNAMRILITVCLTFLFYQSILRQPEGRYFRIIRDYAPYLFIIVMFFNIHDAIFVLNPHDVHHTLLNLDQKIFGVHPTVWMEQFYHPRLTDWFALAYVNFYFITVSLLVLLYRNKEFEQFRIIVLTMMVSYFMGFIGYIFFPASSPYLIIPELYQVDIWKDTSLPSWAAYSIVDLSPYRTRDAFPSMHNGTVFLTMIMAWRYHRTFFWIQFPLAISIPFATIYLRYHYVVDILGVLPVIAFALYISPRLEHRWKEFQVQHANPGINSIGKGGGL